MTREEERIQKKAEKNQLQTTRHNVSTLLRRGGPEMRTANSLGLATQWRSSINEMVKKKNERKKESVEKQQETKRVVVAPVRQEHPLVGPLTVALASYGASATCVREHEPALLWKGQPEHADEQE